LGSLIDTDVISEYRKPDPDAGVIGFLRGLDFRTAYLSVVTLCEIRFGVDRLPNGLRRAQLDHWLTWDLPLDFQDRILLVSDPIAQAAGSLGAEATAAGRPMGVLDAFIAATAQVHGLTLVTRNTRDFEVWAGPVPDPWSADAG
jgi:predicted nucleic acid-binding protein